MKYVALLRGINVGGKAPIKMADLKSCFETHGFENVRTYINSGNVMFETTKTDTIKLAKNIERCIETSFSLPVRVVVIDESHYRNIVKNVPQGWGEKLDWKYNMLFLIPPYDIDVIRADIGELKPDIETMKIGEGIIYQAILFTAFGRTTGGKLASRVSYKKMTIRNWNTTRKLLELL
ncbi:MAG: hypothetical protein JWM00_680 [Candidatus Saccharibacteria bacterium]|nr:hypothetical protein [Candidatus Saccharibacteria bacterium]